MAKLQENKRYYASPAQREVLLNLISHPVIESSFFLTGGTALCVFYLHHRVSDDLDFFTLTPLDFAEIDFWIRSIWTNKCSKIKEGPNFLSFLVNETKVDFVIDPLSNKEERQKVLFENGHYLPIDNIYNIVSNKFSAVVSRVEPKDFIDFYFISKVFPKMRLEDIYKDAKKKDAIFDDPPTAAFQLEEALSGLRESVAILPESKKEFDMLDLMEFYKGIASWLYERIKGIND